MGIPSCTHAPTPLKPELKRASPTTAMLAATANMTRTVNSRHITQEVGPFGSALSLTLVLNWGHWSRS